MRTYSGLACEECGGRVTPNLNACSGGTRSVTAYDSRDVDPLISRVQEAITKLAQPARNQEPDAVSVHLQRALDAFRKGAQDG